MTDYLFTSTLISLCILLTVKGLKNAPARLNFYLLMIALACWFVPWQYLSQLSFFEGSERYTLNVGQIVPDIKVSIPDTLHTTIPNTLLDKKSMWDFVPSISNIFIILLVSGCGLFLLRMGLYVKLIKTYKNL